MKKTILVLIGFGLFACTKTNATADNLPTGFVTVVNDSFNSFDINVDGHDCGVMNYGQVTQFMVNAGSTSFIATEVNVSNPLKYANTFQVGLGDNVTVTIPKN